MSDPIGPRARPQYETVQCRPELARFVRIMEGRLCATDYKAHWSTVTFSYLIDRLRDEIAEMEWAIDARLKPHKIANEAADVAVFALMIADLAIGEYK